MKYLVLLVALLLTSCSTEYEVEVAETNCLVKEVKGCTVLICAFRGIFESSIAITKEDCDCKFTK